MSKRLFLSALVAVVMMLGDSAALAQRGRGGGGRGGGRGGGGGMARPSGGGGMARPGGGGGMARPGGGGGMARPGGGGGAARPGGGDGAARPGGGMGGPMGGMSRPSPSRPQGPAMGNRPGNAGRPGGGAAGRPPGGMSRPSGPVANRPNAGGGANRPTTLPGGRPGGGNSRPGIGGPVNRPGVGGPGNRPGAGGIAGNRPGVGGPGGINRPGGAGGLGNRPGIDNRPGGVGGVGGIGGAGRPGGAGGIGGVGGMNRPGGIGGVGNRPGIDNRPGGIGGVGRPGGVGGAGGIGGAGRPGGVGGVGGINRLGGGNNVGNNVGNFGSGNNIYNNNNTAINASGNNWGGGSNWGSGGYGGGGYWGGGGYGGGGYWGGGNAGNYYGPRWSGANWGNWYHGPNNGFWAGVGTAAIASWGLNALRYPGYAYSSYGSYPAAWSAPVYDSWGISSVADDWMYSGYANPYATGASQTVVIQQPPTVVAGADPAAAAPQQVVAYDYSQPISTATPPEPTAAESAQKVFEAARDSFKAGDYARALSLADQALVQLPNDPTLHEFRALGLLAGKRYDEAAAAAYAVLSTGPGWDWATLISLYPDIDAYTNQLRALEAYVAAKPESATGQFLLAYLYMVQGNKSEASKRFAMVARLQPQDRLSDQLAKNLAPDEERQKIQQALRTEAPPAPPATAGQPAAADGQTPVTTPPPANLVGTWTAKPDAKVAITLVLAQDGAYSWAVTQASRTQTIQGRAGFQDDVLVLGQEGGPALTGKIRLDPAGGAFTFKPPGSSDNVAGLNFTKDKG